jgi:ribosome maturation factor RimP
MTVDLVEALAPVVAAAGLELVDVEMQSGVLQVTVDREGGVDLEALTEANRAVSAVLDELDPFPGRYSLEVSSPGIERPLRTPAHFAKAVGATVTVKTRPQVEGERRRRGVLVAADDEGIELAEEGADGAPLRLAYSDIDRARTVFVWGGSPAPGGRSPAGKTSNGKQTEKKRKQVATP